MNRRTWGMAILIVTIIVSLNLRVPYYIYQPGSAVDLGPMVEVEDSYKQNIKGSFRLTTVRMGPTTIGGYLYASVSPNVDLIKPENVHSPHENYEDYTRRQLHIMRASEDTAKIVAFQKAGYAVQIKNTGAIVLMLIPNYPAEKVLEVGDVIVKVNDTPIETAAKLIDSLQGKQAGEEVEIAFVRDSVIHEGNIALEPLPVQTQDGTAKPGIGIASPVTKRDFELPKQVEIRSGNIGGPSAGLLFTLEIMNQLTKEDLTKGYHIAGTGTILEDGSVGPIGSAHLKVIAAHNAGMDIFFAPANRPGERDSVPSNYEEALAAAQKIKTRMQIVPVETIDDALRYLEGQTPVSH